MRTFSLVFSTRSARSLTSFAVFFTLIFFGLIFFGLILPSPRPRGSGTPRTRGRCACLTAARTAKPTAATAAAAPAAPLAIVGIRLPLSDCSCVVASSFSGARDERFEAVSADDAEVERDARVAGERVARFLAPALPVPLLPPALPVPLFSAAELPLDLRPARFWALGGLLVVAIGPSVNSGSMFWLPASGSGLTVDGGAGARP